MKQSIQTDKGQIDKHPTVAPKASQASRLARWLPTPGNVIFTLLAIGLLIMTQSVWSAPSLANIPGPSATTVNYQGRLADSNGNPLSGSYNLQFAIYDAPTAGNRVWAPENHLGVSVTDGLFSVDLGSQTTGGIPTSTWDGDRYLEITVNGEPLTPRELIRSVPIAGMALTVPDGAITTEKIADGAITVDKLDLDGNLILNGHFTTNNLDVAEMLKVKVDPNVYPSSNDRAPEVYRINNGGPTCTADERGSIFVGRVSEQSTQDSLCACMKLDDDSSGVFAWWCFNP